MAHRKRKDFFSLKDSWADIEPWTPQPIPMDKLTKEEREAIIEQERRAYEYWQAKEQPERQGAKFRGKAMSLVRRRKK